MATNAAADPLEILCRHRKVGRPSLTTQVGMCTPETSPLAPSICATGIVKTVLRSLRHPFIALSRDSTRVCSKGL